MSLLEGLFELDVAICETDHQQDFESLLLPEERTAVERAVPHRRREFAGGRHCARTAMLKLGLPAVPIPMGEDRTPQWPSNVVGSISHCRTRCVAVAALKSAGFVSLGVDIEEAVDLDNDLYEAICAPEEIAAIRLLPSEVRGLAAKTTFSAKECFFKCQFPVTGVMLDFQDVRVDFDHTSGTFQCRIALDALAFNAGGSIVGNFREADGYIVTGISLRSVQQPAPRFV